MGTHGLYGYILNGIYYLMYVHYDGDMLMSVMKREAVVILEYFETIEETRKNFEAIKYIYGNGLKPTKKIIEKLKPWTNLEVETRRTDSWYCLLYHCQKSLIHTLESGFILLNDFNKPTNSRPVYDGYICWWNLDTNEIEFFCGNVLIEKLYPIELMINKPKNFPTKTYDEIIKNFYLKQKETNDLIEKKKSLLKLANEISVPNKLFEIDGMDQEKVKERIINDTEFELKMLVNSSSSYTTLLWTDLGVIYYE